jgi:hypothetical protein
MGLHELPGPHAADANRAVGGLEIAEEQRDERALPRAIRAREAEHLAIADGQREVIDRANRAAEQRAIGVTDALELDQRGVTGGAAPGGRAPGGNVPCIPPGIAPAVQPLQLP